MALTPQIDNQMKNETNSTIIPSKTYELSNDLVTSLVEGETTDSQEYVDEEPVITNRDTIQTFQLRGNSNVLQPEEGEESEGNPADTDINVIKIDDVNINKESGIIKLKGNTTQEVKEALTGTEVTGTDLTITDYDSTKENKFIKLSGNTSQATAILPTEYQQVEYIESTGTQYIDTGVSLNNTIIFKTKLIFLNQTGGVFVGAIAGVDKALRFFNYDNMFYLDFGNDNTGRINGGTCLLNTEYELEVGNHYIKNLKTNTNIISGSTVSAFEYSDLTIGIFKSSNQPSEVTAMGRIYYLKIYDNNILVRDFIPCYRKSDNEIGLYDLVNKVFYTNAGTGTFTKGSNISLPNPNYPIDIQVVKGSNNVKVQNKNLCKINRYNQASTMNGLTISYSNNKLLINGTCTARTDLYVTWFNSDFALLKDYINKNPDTYYGYTNKNNVRVTFYNDSNYRGGYTENSIPVSANVIYGTFFILIPKDTVFNNEYLDVIIEKGQKTSYVAHQEQNYPITLPTGMELCKIGDYQDYIYKNGDNWYKKEYVRHIQLPFSSLSDSSNPGWANVPYIKNDYPNQNGILKDVISFKCNIFLDTFSTIRINTTGNVSAIFLYSANLGGLTGAQLKEKYPDLILDLYYVLETSTETQITDTTLIGQLEAIEEVTGYEDIMYITSTNTTNNENNLAMIPTYYYNFITSTPSPEKSSDIKIVKGANTILIHNKQFFNKNSVTDNYRFEDTEIISDNDYFISDFICVKDIDNIVFSGNSFPTQVVFYDKNGNIIDGIVYTGPIILNENIYAIKFSDLKARKNDILVEEGIESTTYEDYKQQTYTVNLGNIELCKLGDYQDYIYKNGDNWYKKGYVRKRVFPQTSSWNRSETESGTLYKYTGISPFPVENLALGYCNKYPYKNETNPQANWFTVKQNILTIHTEMFETVEDFKASLATENLIVYYPLQNPTETQITDTTLISQLNTIYGAYGYREMTYIFSFNDNLAVIPVFQYNKIPEGIQVTKSRTRIIVQRKKKPDITLELEIGDLELVKINNEYQDKIYKEDNKWYVSKKTAKIASYNGETITTPYISSKNELATGALVYYGQSEVITEITDTTLKTRLDSILDIELDREETKFIQEVDNGNLKSILYIKASTRKVELVIKETDRIIGFIDGLEAVKQAVYHILNVERYAYLIYDNNYGIELEQYIGRGFDYLESTIEQTLREALLHDLRITDVFVLEINKISTDIAKIVFQVQSIYGNLQLEVNVNV